MREAQAEIVPGIRTRVWGYDGQVPGPTIKASQGRRTVVRFVNELPATHPAWGCTPWTSVHLHGSASAPQYDGYANDLTHPGQYKDYVYPNIQPARTLWYHDHGVHHTGENVDMGLAAQYHLTDALEQSLTLPKGDYDVPLILGDLMFTSSGQLMWDDRGDSGLYGDVIAVNGRPWPVMKVERRKYRFRILNGSISRGYLLRLSTGDPLTVVATDGGLMPAPQAVTQLRHGGAERYDVVIDFAKYKIGQRVVLQNRGVANSIDYDFTGQIMAFDVANEPTSLEDNEVPAVLNPKAVAMDLTGMAKTTRRLRFDRTNGIWTINGGAWEDVVASGFTKVVGNPGPGDVEIWEIENSSGGWNHPVHVHLVDFKILDRNGRPPRPEERGPKDVVYVGENETVRVIMKFDHQVGRYMVHCHNLPHEDHDMMSQFEVGSGGADPILTAPARPLSLALPL